MQYQATRDIRASQSTIAAILADIEVLPDWNPAIFSVTDADNPAIAGKPYAVTSKLPGTAILTYQEITPTRIVWQFNGWQAHETGTWDIDPITDLITRVTHTIAHDGMLFRLLSGNFVAVPNLRLDRLQLRSENQRTARGR